MSVILFSKHEVYQQLADAYEGLKHLRLSQGKDYDAHFYKSLRRLYFANVATYLCQYHDDSPLEPNELCALDPFQELQGKADIQATDVEELSRFLEAWRSEERR